jgi:hypothetical protein
VAAACGESSAFCSHITDGVVLRALGAILIDRYRSKVGIRRTVRHQETLHDIAQAYLEVPDISVPLDPSQIRRA